MVVLVALLLFAGCKKDHNPTMPSTGTISGRVTDESHGIAIAGANVSSNPSTSRTITDDQGRYTLTGVPPAIYTVTAMAGSYQWDLEEVIVTAGDTATADIFMPLGRSLAGEVRQFTMGTTTIRMCWVPAGSFMMGRVPDEPSTLDNEDPRHRVTIAHGFWMSKYEITQEQWLAVMWSLPSYFRGVNLPVEQVSWDDIQGFESALGGVYRLPSESEWEYACRARRTTRYYWGHDANHDTLRSCAWTQDNSNSTTHSVGSQRANSWGLCDMSGNVEEWCEDSYHSSYAGAPTDGSAWVADRGQPRVLRGGSWDSDGVWDYRSAARYYSYPGTRSNRFGFRVVASFPSP